VERLNSLLPTGRQFAGAIVFLAQSWGKVAGAAVVALNNDVVLTPEVVRILLLALVVVSVPLVTLRVLSARLRTPDRAV
jgi:hypothetical protein